MKILVLCGCIEPGRDGVGDYTRRLVGELIRQGNDCRIVALNDSHSAQTIGVDHTHTQDGIQVLRLQRTASWEERMEVARDWICSFKPDWISLQFVPYSFQNKGLPVGLGSRLKQLAPQAKWHVMFHELWIGMEEGSPLRQRFVGFLQKNTIRNLVRVLRPPVIHTQSGLYIKQLKTLGIPANHLPLFGNIPVRDNGEARTGQCDSCTRTDRNRQSLRLIHFGTVRPNTPFVKFAAHLVEYAKMQEKVITLSLVGRAGDEAESWKRVFESAGIHFVNHGEKSPDEISRLFLESDVGVITTPIALAEKSGALAAMREHGLPSLAVTSRWKAIGIIHPPLPEGVFNYVGSGLDHLLDQMHKSAPSLDALEIKVKRMMTDLAHAN